ncbi:ABC transporter permease [Candidatus Latescibacterota bacterium]
MIGILILKELQSYLKQFHYYLLALILLILFVVNGIFFSHEYVEQNEYYERQINEISNRITGPNVLSPPSRTVIFPPSPSLFCSSNNVNFTSISFNVRMERLTISQTTEEKGNFFLPIAQSMDWTFIVQIIFSIVIILLSYNAITGEKEKKTLALIGSNSVSRFQIYISKFISLFSASSIILLISMLMGLITILIIGRIPVDSFLIGRLGIFFLVSMLYGSIFILIGLGCSVFSHSSTLSLLSAISMWLLLVIVLPESIDIAVKSTQTEPSNYELQQMYNEEEFDFNPNAYSDLKNMISPDRTYSDTEKEQLIEGLNKRMVELDNENVLRKRAIIDYIRNVYTSRYWAQQQWKRFSPAIVFRMISEKLFYGGNYRFLDLLEQINNFSNSFHEDMYRRYNIRRDRIGGIMGTAVEINGERVMISLDRPSLEYNGMEFLASKHDLRESLSLMMNDFIILLLLLTGLGVFGFIKFINYDIR